jgi:uncharacterized protein YuzE
MPKIHYDPEVKILSIRFKEEKSVDSDVNDNVVLDYDKDGHIVNIDVMEVSLEDLIQTTGNISSSKKPGYR